jgi:hypothetical protein
MKWLFVVVPALAVCLFSAGGCCNRPLFGGGSPYSYNYGPQYYAQPVQQPQPIAAPVQPVQYIQPQMACPQVCPQVCQPCY